MGITTSAILALASAFFSGMAVWSGMSSGNWVLVSFDIAIAVFTGLVSIILLIVEVQTAIFLTAKK